MKAKENNLQVSRKYYNTRFGSNTSFELNNEEKLRWEILEQQLMLILKRSSTSTLKILDFGCGNGRFSALMTEFGEVTGVDIAEIAIERARESFPNVHFKVGDVSSPDVIGLLDNQTFDCIVSTEVIEHLQNSEQGDYLKNIYKLLKSEGYLILTTPNKRWFSQYFKDGTRKDYQPVENWFSSFDLEADLMKNKFTVYVSLIFRSSWIFEFKTSGLLRLIGNRYFRNLLELFAMKRQFIYLANKLGLGINQLFVARK